MITPRKGTETGHHMNVVHVSTTLTNHVQTTINRHCQTCNNRRKVSKHPIGLKVCSRCGQAINQMFLSHDIQLNDIKGWNKKMKQQWITRIDQLGLYVPVKPKVSTIATPKVP